MPKTLMGLSSLVAITGVMLLLSFSVEAAQIEPITIDWWLVSNNQAELEFWLQIADEFMQSHPHVQIHASEQPISSRLPEVMAAGYPPDLFLSSGGPVLWAYADAGLLRNIAPQLEGEWKNSFAVPAALELYGQNGAYFGVPWTWGAVGIFYNKALFEQAGLDPENPPATWTEFLDAIVRLKNAGITPIALGELVTWPGHFWWSYLALRYGGEVAFFDAYSRRGSFTDAAFVQAGAALKQLIDLEPFPVDFLNMSYVEQETMFGNGEAAMSLMGEWGLEFQASYSETGDGIGDDLGWFRFPVVEGGTGDPRDILGSGKGFAVGANAPDETIDFLRYITDVEVQQRGVDFGFLPTIRGVAIDDNPVMRQILDARNNAAYFQLYYDQIQSALGYVVNDSTEALFREAVTPLEAAQMIEEVASVELAS